MSGRGYRTKLDGLRLAKAVWTCTECLEDYEAKTAQCACGSHNVHRFPSRAEMRRYKALRMELHHGLIENLVLQPVFPIKINGALVTKYIADFQYTRNGETVVEDVKGVSTDVFKLKRKLVEASYGFRLKIVKER